MQYFILVGKDGVEHARFRFDTLSEHDRNCIKYATILTRNERNYVFKHFRHEDAEIVNIVFEEVVRVWVGDLC